MTDDVEKRERFEGDQEPDFEQVRQFYRQNFNTELSPEEEFRFHDWADRLGRQQNRYVLEDLDDYDLRGAFKEGAAAAENGRFSDRHKKPNHPTFSTESVYHGVPDPHHGGTYEGGTWGSAEDGRETFAPSRKMLQTTHPESWLRGYFREREPEVSLITGK